jgi:hypothetical protein
LRNRLKINKEDNIDGELIDYAGKCDIKQRRSSKQGHKKAKVEKVESIKEQSKSYEKERRSQAHIT